MEQVEDVIDNGVVSGADLGVLVGVVAQPLLLMISVEYP